MKEGSGIYERDSFVIRSCLERRVAVAAVIGGGYGREIDALARRHCLLQQATRDVYDDVRP